MKKMKFFALVILVAILGTSCSERNYDCTCTYKDITGAVYKDVVPMKGTKKDAQNACNAHGSNLTYYHGTPVTCRI
jgi:PBP1b-binding outer membrane lipoprotein LpoB